MTLRGGRYEVGDLTGTRASTVDSPRKTILPARGKQAPEQVADKSSVIPVSVSTSSQAIKSGAAATTNGTVATTAATSVPAWVSTLTTAAIKADMMAADVNGTVTEAGLEKLFADLANSLAGATLTSAELADLKTVVANLNVGMSTSSYLTYIATALVDGNAANATWTGGGAQSVALGNLATGDTATHVTELVDKWFLGSDLPSSLVSMSGYSNFTVSYSDVSKPLFAATGPAMADVNQGYLGDCYLLSSLAEVADQDPSAISSMITDNGNNTYGVRFYYHGTAEYVTVDNALADGGTIFNKGPDLWASLVEQAYVQFQTINLDTGNAVNDGNAMSTIGNGGSPAFALEAITDAPIITEFCASGASWCSYNFNQDLNCVSYSSSLSTGSVLATLETDLADGYDLVLSSFTSATDSSGKTTLVDDHALSIYGYDSSTGELEIRNPWGTEAGQYWDTTFEVSLATLLADGDTVSVAEVGGLAPSVVTNALVSSAAGLQANSAVAGFMIADSAANVSANLTALASDTKLLSISLTDATTPTLTLTSAQYAADAAVLALIASNHALRVTGATVGAAAGLQAKASVTSFTVSDKLDTILASAAALGADSKLTSITLTNPIKQSISLTGAQYAADAAALAKITSPYSLTITAAPAGGVLNLTGQSAAMTINLGANSASVSAGLSAPKMSFIATPDAITLGTGASTIDYALQPGSGIETIANFALSLDTLNITLSGQSLKAFDTSVGGVAAISLASTADPSHGIVLLNVPKGLTAMSLMASHVTMSGGHALIS